MGKWKADLNLFLQRLQQQEQKAKTDKQRVAALVTTYLHDTVIAALQDFQSVVEQYRRRVAIRPGVEVNRPDESVTRSVRITIDSGNRRELECEILVLGSADLDMLIVGATYSDVTHELLDLSGKPEPRTSTYFFQNRLNRDEPPTRDDILNHLVILFKLGAKRSKG